MDRGERTRHDDKSVLKSDWFRWMVGVCVAAIVAYFTTISAIRDQIAAVTNVENGHYQQLKAVQESNFGEVIRRMEIMQMDVRELRETQRAGAR